MTRSGLRAALWDLTGGMCEWPNCSEQADEMAHIEPSGMGGRSSVDTIGNVMALCRDHHNILDGRPSQMKTSRAMRDLAAGYLASRRSMIDPEDWIDRRTRLVKEGKVRHDASKAEVTP